MMTLASNPFQHRRQLADGSTEVYPAGKVVCVGLNYRDHVSEMNSQVAAEPVLFIKPATALVPLQGHIAIPTEFGACHHEAEMAILIGDTLTNQPQQPATEQQAAKAIAGVGVALDLTLRELQAGFKERGHPWEKAKGFDGACPISHFIDISQITDLQDITIRLTRNNDVRQESSTAMMITPVLPLLVYISQFFTLHPGDVVLTGTPAGVGPLEVGDQLKVELDGLIDVDTSVVIR